MAAGWAQKVAIPSEAEVAVCDGVPFRGRREDACGLVLRSEHCVALLAAAPVVPHHLLVFSPLPAARHLDLPAESGVALMGEARTLARLIEKVTDASATTFVMKECGGGEIGGCVLHLMPRRRGDFAENDEVYERLEKVDVDDRADDPFANRLTTEELAWQAAALRKVLRAEEDAAAATRD